MRLYARLWSVRIRRLGQHWQGNVVRVVSSLRIARKLICRTLEDTQNFLCEENELAVFQDGECCPVCVVGDCANYQAPTTSTTFEPNPSGAQGWNMVIGYGIMIAMVAWM